MTVSLTSTLTLPTSDQFSRHNKISSQYHSQNRFQTTLLKFPFTVKSRTVRYGLCLEGPYTLFIHFQYIQSFICYPPTFFINANVEVLNMPVLFQPGWIYMTYSFWSLYATAPFLGGTNWDWSTQKAR